MLEPIIEAADARAFEADTQLDRFKGEAERRGSARGLAAALSAPGLSIVAEIKRRSPSVGVIDAGLDPVTQAVAYEKGGADAISVLTEPFFFDGSLDDLVAVSEAVSLPVLRKDFIRNEAQIYETRAVGADAALLIVSILTQVTLESLILLAADIGLDVIVEAHSGDEVERAVASGAAVIGVNNRDLETFRTDISVSEILAEKIPDAVVSIAESGVSSSTSALRMRDAGYDAILVGEALVRATDPEVFVRELRGGV